MGVFNRSYLRASGRSFLFVSGISCHKTKSGTVVSGRSYLYQDKVKIRCANGDVHEMQCQADRTWDPNIGIC